MSTTRRNKNRGYQQLLVWQDAIELYGLAYSAVRGWPFELKKLASQAIASSDSVHRNIAEGYCRRTVREYLQHLNIALGSLGETLSGFIAYSRNGQIERSTFEQLDTLIFRLENRLLKLVGALELKRDANDWTETLVVRAGLVEYNADPDVTHDLELLLEGVME
ncbi:four helix bundle protein [Verrucomicrobium spinosum]|uniref:four helix bundle protein n=1 Tax=Verrucomicrobium spinosum TaxID=2736 RepID=UPI0001746828|nr:four helix bundle protein [Verrucomicrobium spinosum]